MKDLKKLVLSSISELKSLGQNRYSKYERNLRLYESTMNLALDSIRDTATVGFYKGGSHYDTTADISINIIKSCIDTLTSKISSVKVRPFFNTVQGGYKDIRTVKAAQQYFDMSFDYNNVHKEISEAFRASAIFEKGIIYVDPFNAKVSSVLPWQVYYRPSEATYGRITRVYYERKQYPTTLLPSYKGKEQYVAYGVYFDTVNHVKAEMLSDNTLLISEYTPDVIPFVIFNYCNPVMGDTNQSIVDMLLPIQLWIDELANTAKDASQLNPAHTILLPEGTGIEAHKFTNGIGNLVTYSVPPNFSSSPVTVATPPFIDPQYMKTIEELKQTAYELVGISQLSATSQKPTGLNSGVALQTIENIESDRFETQFDAYIRMYSDVARTIMKVLDPDTNILPRDRFRSDVTWKDIAAEEKNMKLQFSGADALSKDPSTKFQVIQMYAQSSLIPREMITKLLDIPDMDMAYSYMNNQWDAVQTVIDRCIYEGKYEVPPFVSYPLLQKEILNTQLLLFNAGYDRNAADIARLTTLFQVTFDLSMKLEAVNQEALERQQAQSAAGYSGSETLTEESEV